MKLLTKVIPNWPKLAWVASISAKERELTVLHGPMVETTDRWIAEAVWAGDFGAGDFDRTELVFGTGIRCGDGIVEFVSSGTTFDRLWHTTHQGKIWVANSLPGLMAVTGLQLQEDYPHYRHDLHTIKQGLQARTKGLPTNGPSVISTYFNNLKLVDGELTEVEKVDTAPSFKCYEDYRSYLFKTAEMLQENLASPLRNHRVSTLCGISSGYDSCATAVVARAAGCTDTVTIKDSTSFWRGSDSGKPVADALGMNCREYSRTATAYPLEESVWAACAWGGMLNWTLFDYPEPLCLFFSGCHGEKMWDRLDHDHPDPFVRRDIASLGFCEFRLFKGVWQCVVPFWGVRHSAELKKITNSAEMRPWYMNQDYDKPIARRIVEEAGVPRTAFGQTKKNAVLPDPFPWPRSASAQASFRDELRRQGRFAPGRPLAELIRRTASIESLLHQNINSKLGIKKRLRPWNHIGGSSALFCWANAQVQTRYASGLKKAVNLDNSVVSNLP